MHLVDALGGIDIDYAGEDNLPFGGEMIDGELVGVNAWLTPGLPRTHAPRVDEENPDHEDVTRNLVASTRH